MLIPLSDFAPDIDPLAAANVKREIYPPSRDVRPVLATDRGRRSHSRSK